LNTLSARVVEALDVLDTRFDNDSVFIAVDALGIVNNNSVIFNYLL